MTDQPTTPAQVAVKPDLMPCPFCGTTEMLRHIGANPGDGWGFVRCDYCDAEGPDPDVFSGGWNTRAAPAPAEQEPVAEAELDEAWKSGFNAGFGEAMLTRDAHPAPVHAVPDDVAKQVYELQHGGCRAHLTAAWGAMDKAADTIEAQAAELARLREAITDALGRYQVTHIHEGLRAALTQPTGGSND